MPRPLDAVILCGGVGSRLKSVTGNAPKSMASIAERPFLELLLRQLARNGFRRTVLAVGYQKEVIAAHFGARAFGLDLKYSPESSPLGTGGALRNAVELTESNAALVMNGDSYTDVELDRLIGQHRSAGAEASLVVVPVDGRSDHGSVVMDAEGRVVKFEEKRARPGAKYLNAGIYVIARALLGDVSLGRQVSLERELFPQWLEEGRRVQAYTFPGTCVDIGTPERYENAQRLLAKAELEERRVASGNRS